MIKTPTVVKKLFLQSDTAQLAAADGILNVSAFARKIQKQAESAAMKEIALGTITTALYRILEETPINFKPAVQLSDLRIHGNVSAITFNKTSNLGELLSALSQRANYYTITQGSDETTIIADTEIRDLIIESVGKPKAAYDNLVAVSVTFDEKYLSVPNMIYTLMASLAVKRINVMEIVSTLTSLTFIVEAAEMEKTVAALKRHLG